MKRLAEGGREKQAEGHESWEGGAKRGGRVGAREVGGRPRSSLGAALWLRSWAQRAQSVIIFCAHMRPGAERCPRGGMPSSLPAADPSVVFLPVFLVCVWCVCVCARACIGGQEYVDIRQVGARSEEPSDAGVLCDLCCVLCCVLYLSFSLRWKTMFCSAHTVCTYTTKCMRAHTLTCTFNTRTRTHTHTHTPHTHTHTHTPRTNPCITGRRTTLVNLQTIIPHLSKIH